MRDQEGKCSTRHLNPSCDWLRQRTGEAGQRPALPGSADSQAWEFLLTMVMLSIEGSKAVVS